MEKAIVTGATGFIGFALVKRLVESGIKVYAVVREQSREISKLIQLPGCYSNRVQSGRYGGTSRLKYKKGSLTVFTI